MNPTNPTEVLLVKRFSLLFIGFLAALLVFPLTINADEADYVTSTLKLTNVIDIVAEGDDEFTNNGGEGTDSLLEIIQKSGSAGSYQYGLNGFSSSNTTARWPGSVDVTVRSLTSFSVAATYAVISTEGGSESSTGLILLEDGGGGTYDLHQSNTQASLWPGGGKPSETDLTEVYSGSSDITGSNSKSFKVKVDLDKLQGSYENGDAIDFEISFWAYDSET